jgi:DNA (cytosine-5)-methyltransferase 1
MPTALSRPLKIGTDCSGMETPVMALKRLGVSYEHTFSCDIDKSVKTQLLANFPAKKWYDDLMKRDNDEVPDTDLYVAGFPCQSFSAAGLQKGFKDKRGKVFYGVARFIIAKEPRAFILENVKRLITHNKGKTLQKVLECLRSINKGMYNVEYQVINTADHGVPQSRPRVYFIGIRKDRLMHKFEFPEPLKPVSLESLLDPVQRRPTMEDNVPKSSGTAWRNTRAVLRNLIKEGEKPLTKDTWIVDIDASPHFLCKKKDSAMCMTKSRGSGFWITSRGRRMNVKEMLKCQGMEKKAFKQVVTDKQLGMQIGNAMSQNVLERILVKLLPAAGLVHQDTDLNDRWANKAGKLKPISSLDSSSKKRTMSLDGGSPKKRTRVREIMV